MAKIYLSPAAHLHDNPTKCPSKCGENIHCNLYMDKLQKRLTDLGFEVKRGDKALTGSPAMTQRVSEANKWKADLYYVAHSNAGGGRYGVTFYYPGTSNQNKANILHKYRKAKTHKIKANNSLYEINATAMTCLYDELFFHDNAEDCKWFHNGGLEIMVEETCQAMCEIFGKTYKKEVVTPAPTPIPTYTYNSDDLTKLAKYIARTGSLTADELKKYDLNGDGKVNSDDLTLMSNIIAKTISVPTQSYAKGATIVLNNTKLYGSSTTDKYTLRTGTYYIYDGVKVNGRYRITNSASRVGKLPVGTNVTGWIQG